MCARMQQQLQMPAIRSARRDHWSAGVLVWLVGWLSKVCVRFVCLAAAAASEAYNSISMS